MRSKLCLSVAILATSGCDAKPSPGPAASATTTASAKASSSTAPSSASPPPVVKNEGAAYLATQIGVTVVNDGKISEVAGIGDEVSELVVATDGLVYARAGELHAIRGTSADKTPVIAFNFTPGLDGKVWFPDGNDIKFLEGTTTQKIAFPDESPYHVGITSKGELFAATDSTLYERSGETWKKLDLESVLPKPRRFLGYASHPASPVLYAIAERGIARRDAKGTWSKVELGFNMVQEVGPLSPDGALPLSTERGVVVLTGEGVSAPLPHETLGGSPGDVDAVAVDTRGRRWIGTQNGLVVASADNEILQRYAPGVLPSHVEAIVVIGGGPTLPPKLPAPVTVGIKGKLIVTDAPAANTPIQLCMMPSVVAMSKDDTPCGDSKVHFATKTDGDGAFAVSKMPRQRYLLAFKRGEEWRSLMSWGSKRCCADLQQDETRDMGEILVR
ncbi:MAG: hypothetical protein JRI23_10375 [Deltaproteobacteria bacterium]|jgi:hypothetical protein|nr:hypothetical protein [Deltaproteobacteria bacterium]MBW2532074.1 hypothetical protein [Deltaproteobacteria bacterium]